MSFPSNDTFTRSIATGLGTATIGGNWTVSNSSLFSVNGSEAIVAVPAGISTSMSLTGTNLNTEFSAVFSFDKIPVGGTAVARLQVRRIATSNDYHLRATLDATGSLKMRMANTDVAYISTSYDIAYTAGTKVHFKVKATGSSPTQLYAKTWLEGQSEPSNWQQTSTDSASILQAAGYVGISYAVQAAVSNGPITLKVDDWSVVDATPPVVPTLNHAGVYSFSATEIGVGVSTANITSIQLRATPASGGSTITGTAVSPSAGSWAYAKVTGLTAGTEYNVAVVDVTTNTVLDTLQSRTLTTLRRDFVALSSSCQRTGSNHAGWASLKAENADFFAHQGDLHYLDASVESTWRDGMNNALGASNMRDFLRDTPMTYHYDNHDWGGNTSWKGSPAGAYIPTAIRELMGDQADTIGMYSTWASGGVRFVETDQWALRDEAVTAPSSDNSVGKSMLGLTQRQWLLDTFENSTESLIIWLCSFPLYGNYLGNGRWGNFRDEAAIINTWLTAHPEIKSRIVCVGGDSHNICADDGTNTMWGLPSLNSSPIDRSGDTPSTVSGTWNIANTLATYAHMYYSRMSFVWSNSGVTFTWQAKRSDGTVEASWSKLFSSRAPKIVVGGVKKPATWSVVQGGVEVPITKWSQVQGGVETPLKNSEL